MSLLRVATNENGRRAAQRHYFAHVLPRVLEVLRQTPSHEALRSARTHTLVSLMGFSPETTIIAAAIVQPKRLVVLLGQSDAGEASVESSYDDAVDYLKTHKILEPSSIELRRIDSLDPLQMYRVLSRVLRDAPIVDNDRSAMVDVTGGKKVMSATAAQAAWELDIPLCYTEGTYDATLRRPKPGSERVLRLPNPSQQRLQMLRSRAFDLQADLQFGLAAHAFRLSADHQVENQVDELGAALSHAYASWMTLDLPQLSSAVQDCHRNLSLPRTQLIVRHSLAIQQRLHAQLDALEQLASGDPLARLASFRKLALLYGGPRLQRHDFACLLAYRGLEASVMYALQRVASSRERTFQPDSPDWEQLTDDPNKLREAFVAFAREVDPRTAPVDLPRQVGLLDGLCVWAALTPAAGVDHANRLRLVRDIRGASALRNKSILAHGNRTLSPQDLRFMANKADQLLRALLGDALELINSLADLFEPIDLRLLAER